MIREVKFNEYCNTCKHKNVPQEKDPCHECLANPGNEDSRKPIKWEEKEK